MEEALKDTVFRQRELVAQQLHARLARLAESCLLALGDRERLNGALIAGLGRIPSCNCLFVTDPRGIQLSDNVTPGGIQPGHYGRDRSQRPYMREAVPAWGFLLSDAYVNLVSGRPSLTALHVLRSGEGLLGYVGANFDLRELPMTACLYEEPSHWVQVKGDPSIRSTVFQQTRTESPLDRNMDQALSIIEELFVERGLFQGLIHFSSSQLTGWTLDDPLRYRILDHEALSDPDICLAYPRRPYAEEARIPSARVPLVLQELRQLRVMDETLYLRSAMLNLFNGMVSLTFSCDGTHYMPYDEFLSKDIGFWTGSIP